VTRSAVPMVVLCLAAVASLWLVAPLVTVSGCARGDADDVSPRAAVSAEPSATAAVSARSASAAPGDEPEEPTALATRLLAAIYTQPMDGLQVEVQAGRARRESECRLVARWMDDHANRCRASLTVDSEREEIRTYVGPLLTNLPDRSPDGRLKTAEGFARAHLGPFTDATKLVSQKKSMDVLFMYTWANVLPSGAWTGDWWSVEVDANPKAGGVHAFIRQHAPRSVTEDEVKLSRDDAIEAAMRALRRSEGGTESPEPTETRLVLSSPGSPTNGPVWHVTFSAGRRERLDFQIDGMTGKVLRP